MPQTDKTTFLIRQLAERGVRHLRMVDVDRPVVAVSPITLICDLAASSEPRLRESLIPLFLRHPEYATLLPGMLTHLEETPKTILQHMYTTAVYLQRLWQGTLTLYLGENLFLPDYFGQSEFQLPPPEEQFGEAGLRRLAAIFQTKTGDNWWSSYQNIVSLFLAQLQLESH